MATDNLTGAGLDVVKLGETIRAFNDADKLVNGMMTLDVIGLDKTLKLVCIAHKTTVNHDHAYVLGSDVYLNTETPGAVHWGNGSYDYTLNEVKDAYYEKGILKTIWYSAEYRQAHSII